MKTTVDISMSWTQAMKVYIVLLKEGTPEGQKQAEKELMNLASYVDGFFAADEPMDPLGDEEVTA